MKLAEISRILQANWLTGGLKPLETREVLRACGADLMSDILTHTQEGTLLITGLTTGQVVKTALLIDLAGVVFVRGKRPGREVVLEAEEHNIPLLATERSFYESCGLLYQAGLPGCRTGFPILGGLS
ncbi:MAG: DRTGG domain-containing protein [Clostridia bacterium]|nr:DRTGG domain-containing protein [Clostridia bacterium]